MQNQNTPSTSIIHKKQQSQDSTYAFQKVHDLDEQFRVSCAPASSNQIRQLPKVPLVKLDLKTEQLNDFLQMVTVTLNDHAKLIKSLQSQLSRRVHDTQLGNIINAIGSSFPQQSFLPHLRNAKTLNKNTLILNKQLFGAKLHYMDFQNLQKGANFFADRLFYLGSTVGYLLENKNTLKQEIAKLQEMIEARVTKTQFKAKLKRQKVKYLNKFKDCQDIIIDHVQQIRAKMSRYQDEIVQKVDIIQQDLQKRVTGIQREVSMRCTQQLVRDLIKQIEERLMRDYIKRSRQIEDSLQSLSQQFKKQLREMQTKNSQRNRDNKDKIEAMEQWKFKYLTKDKFQVHIKEGDQEHGQIRAMISEQERMSQHLNDRIEQVFYKVNNIQIAPPTSTVQADV